VGLELPIDRITVDLAPAELRKEGAAFDLPVAVGILSATGLVKPGRLDRALVMGELSLDGSVRPVRGVLPIAIHARREGSPRCSCRPTTRPRPAWSRASRSSPSPPPTTRSST
jgi:predicted ATPase with chaperone activity